MAIPTKADPGSMLEAVMLEGDLSKMPPEQRVKYYNEVCTSLRLNPLTRPFQYIVLNGKLQLYALRACTDQLRKIHGISLEIVSRDVSEDTLTVHVRAKAADGRIDEDIGVVAFPGNLRGDARANTEMKAVTKAKRRATLSLCGLGWLDETEIETIKDAKPVAGPDALRGERGQQHQTAAPADPAPMAAPRSAAPSGARTVQLAVAEIQALESRARAAAERGSAALTAFWRELKTDQERKTISGLSGELITLRNAADDKIAHGVDPMTGEVLAQDVDPATGETID